MMGQAAIAETEVTYGPWELPKGWKWVKLKEVTRAQADSAKPSNGSKKLIRYLGLEDVQKGQWEDVEPRLIAAHEIKSTCITFTPSHILYAKLRPYLNKVVVPSDDGFGSTEWVPLRIDPARLDRNYLAWYLRSPWFVGYASSSSNTSGARMPRIRMEALWSAPVPIPSQQEPTRSLDTQHRIVTRIEALMMEVKKAHTLLKHMCHLTDQMMDAALSEIFCATNIRKWPNNSKLGRLVTISAHQVDPRLPEHKALPHIGVDIIESRTCLLGRYRTAEEDGVSSSKYLFDPGVVLYSKIRPYLRKVTLVDFTGLCSSDIYPLSLISDKLFPRFLMWSLVAQPFTNFAMGKSGRTRMPKINRTDLFSYEYCFPNCEEQNNIINRLDNIQLEINKMKRLLAHDAILLDQLEKSILERAFRGEL